MRIVICNTGQEPMIAEIADELRAMQAIVGGYIEAVDLGGGIILVCNEDGMALRLPQNRCAILGNFFVTKGNPEGDFVSLTDGETQAVLAYLAVYKRLRHRGACPTVVSFSSLDEMRLWLENRSFDEDHRN